VIAWICVGIAFVAGFAAGCAFMVWAAKELAKIEGAIAAACKY